MTENPYALTVDEIGRAVARAAHAFFTDGIYIPLMIWGDPGLGKTQAVAWASSATKSDLIVQHVADREPTEMGGIYWERGGEMIRLPPKDLPFEDGKPTILFFDETPQAPMMNKNLLARIILDREIAGQKLGDKVYVCAAGNYMHNRAGTSAMPAHLNARLTHLHAVPDVDNWKTWAAKAGLHPFVLAYHSVAPGDHHVPNAEQDASPNPRSWKRASDIEFSGMLPQVRKAAIVGTLGREVGTRYLMQTELFAAMPDPDDVIADPKKAPIPDNRGTLYALMSALAAKAKPANIGAIIDYTSRLVGNEEYQALCLREAKTRNPAVTSAAAYTKFAMSSKGQALA